MHDNGRYVKSEDARSAAPPPPVGFSTGLSTGCKKGRENVEKGKVRKLRPPPVQRACTTPYASLECRLRRARSASRSKPNLRAVREGRKAKAKGQQERWTKAKPARRNYGPTPKVSVRRPEASDQWKGSGETGRFPHLVSQSPNHGCSAPS